MGKVRELATSAHNIVLDRTDLNNTLISTSTSWKLASNTVVLVTVAEIEEALALAINAAGVIVLNA